MYDPIGLFLAEPTTFLQGIMARCQKRSTAAGGPRPSNASSYVRSASPPEQHESHQRDLWMVLEVLDRTAEGDARRLGHGIAVRAGADGGEGDALDSFSEASRRLFR